MPKNDLERRLHSIINFLERNADFTAFENTKRREEISTTKTKYFCLME